jgi:hypothetical protein
LVYTIVARDRAADLFDRRTLLIIKADNMLEIGKIYHGGHSEGEWLFEIISDDYLPEYLSDRPEEIESTYYLIRVYASTNKNWEECDSLYLEKNANVAINAV